MYVKANGESIYLGMMSVLRLDLPGNRLATIPPPPPRLFVVGRYTHTYFLRFQSAFCARLYTLANVCNNFFFWFFFLAIQYKESFLAVPEGLLGCTDRWKHFTKYFLSIFRTYWSWTRISCLEKFNRSNGLKKLWLARERGVYAQIKGAGNENEGLFPSSTRELMVLKGLHPNVIRITVIFVNVEVAAVQCCPGSAFPGTKGTYF